MTQGISRQYYGRIIQFQWKSFPVVREKQYQLQLAEQALQDAVTANELEGEIDRLTSLRNDAKKLLKGIYEASLECDYTVGYFTSEAAYNTGEPAVLTERFQGHVLPEHQSIYADLAKALYEDREARIA
jgi:hypothetical protein